MKEFITTTMMVERDGQEIEIDIDGYVSFSIDYSYGADADGNRGTSRTFVDDITDLSAYDMGKDFILTENEKEQAADILTRKFLEG